tara:strand:- start:3080 stop:3781 length:702 start_codon:yes stop_codon:yes gene_type:complete
MTSPAVWKQGVFRINSHDKAEICETKDEDGEICRTIDGMSTGTGFAVETTKEKNKTHIITAAHVCSLDMAPPIDINELHKRGIRVKSFERTLFVDDGVSQVPAEVKAVDLAHDLCLLEIKVDVKKEFEISDVYPAYSEEIYNIGAPAGFYEPGAKFYLEGHYVGVIFQWTAFAPKPVLQQVFSIPGVGGLSGSPLINQEGRIVGMIHSIRLDYPYITFSCTIDDLNRLISHVL